MAARSSIDPARREAAGGVSTRTHQARPDSRRSRFREALAAADGPARFALAYDWLRSELATLDKLEPGRASAMRQHVADMLLADAEQLAGEAIERAKAGRHGMSRRQLSRIGQRVRGIQ
jgi:hypothetical protein